MVRDMCRWLLGCAFGLTLGLIGAPRGSAQELIETPPPSDAPAIPGSFVAGPQAGGVAGGPPVIEGQIIQGHVNEGQVIDGVIIQQGVIHDGSVVEGGVVIGGERILSERVITTEQELQQLQHADPVAPVNPSEPGAKELNLKTTDAGAANPPSSNDAVAKDPAAAAPASTPHVHDATCDGRCCLTPGNPLWEAFVDLIRQGAVQEARAQGAENALREHQQHMEQAMQRMKSEMEKVQGGRREGTEKMQAEQREMREMLAKLKEENADLRRELEKTREELKKQGSQPPPPPRKKPKKD